MHCFSKKTASVIGNTDYGCVTLTPYLKARNIPLKEVVVAAEAHYSEGKAKMLKVLIILN